MHHTPFYRLAAVVSTLALVSGIVLGTAGTVSLAASRSVTTHRGFDTLQHETVLPVSTHQARMMGRRNASASMEVSFGLPYSHLQALHRVVAQVGHGMKPLTQHQFDTRFGVSKARVRALTSWLRARGLHTIYTSPDGSIIEAAGATRRVSSALKVQIDTYRFGTRQFYANSSNPTVPARLGVSTVVGLNSYQHGYFVGLKRRNVPNCPISPSGEQCYFPKHLRAAYDVSQHSGSGSGQTIGYTLWGAPDPNSDLSTFATKTGDTKVVSCATTTSATAPAACTGSHAANTIQWVEINPSAKSKADISGLGETAMDVEYGHGIAPNSHLKYFLGGDGEGANLVAAVSAAAGDKTIHVVSNSWGLSGIKSLSDSTAKQFETQFTKALAVGTTFFFSSGDSAYDSGCPRQGSKAQVDCGLVSYPAFSPQVASVGGTNLQMNSNSTAYNFETVWNNLQFTDGSGGYNVQGGGSGCVGAAANRPTFQKNIASLTLNASCAGRAEPDISADADPGSGVLVVATEPKQGGGSAQGSFAEGGTSLASPLWTGMMVDTFNFQTAHKKSLSWNKSTGGGFLTPQLYKLAESSLYHTYFHDVVCGYNGSPAAAGWDQATGWGSPDWFTLTEGLSKMSVSNTGKAPTNCQLSGSADQSSKLQTPFAKWPSGSQAGTEKGGKQSTTWLEGSTTNPFRQLQTNPYSTYGVKGNFGQSANITMAGNKTPLAFWVGTYYPNNADAAKEINDFRSTLAKLKLTSNDCSVGWNNTGDLTPNCLEFEVNLGGSPQQDGIIFAYALNNTVGEVWLQAPDSIVTASQSNFNAWQTAGGVIAADGVTALNSATNTSMPFPAPPPAGKSVRTSTAFRSFSPVRGLTIRQAGHSLSHSH